MSSLWVSNVNKNILKMAQQYLYTYQITRWIKFMRCLVIEIYDSLYLYSDYKYM